jgi:ferredoxin
MRVCVSIRCPESLDLENAVLSHIGKHWTECLVIPRAGEIPKEVEALLIIGAEPQYNPNSILLLDRVITDGSIEETLFQVDAKLGKLTHSDLVKTKVSMISHRDMQVSRRDLFNFRGGFQAYSDAPFVFAERCDAKSGCSICVDVCPAKSLRISDGMVLVSESDCVRCGLCAENCPNSAIQLPKFSEDAFIGLLDGINMSEAPKKTLVITCNQKAVEREHSMCVEAVNDVGVIGPRHLALAASSSVGAVIVYCADGRCVGRKNAMDAVNLMRYISRDDGTILAYAEGVEGASEIRSVHSLSRSPKAPVPFTQKTWQTYVKDLKSIAREDAPAAGLRLTSLTVSEACTLCGVCARDCPHSALKLTSGALLFDSASCTGCSHCASVCPEHAIELGPMKKIADLHEVSVSQDQVIPCARCGKPLESARFLKKISALLGKDDPMMKYCNDCKQLLAFENLMKRGGQGVRS